MRKLLLAALTGCTVYASSVLFWQPGGGNYHVVAKLKDKPFWTWQRITNEWVDTEAFMHRMPPGFYEVNIYAITPTSSNLIHTNIPLYWRIGTNAPSAPTGLRIQQ